MSAHRARHGLAGAGMRPVADILAGISPGSGGTATLRPERTPLMMAAAAAVGAGTAAVSVTGTFPAIQLPELLGFDHPTHQILGLAPEAQINPEAAATAVPSPRSAPAEALAPVSHTPAAYTQSVAAPPASFGGTVMAGDLHQADARQIAALSRAVPVSRPAAPASAPSSTPQRESHSEPTSAVGGLLGGALSALSLPSSLNGVPILGDAGSKAGALALRKAVTKKGLPYIWGGTGPRGYDCSGIVQWAFKQVGINLPRTSAMQSRVGTPVSKKDLKPGDLVFFYSPVAHVGIYIGNNKVFNAYTSGQPLKVSDMTHMPFHNARRITGA
jgi:cell wall-associated NlpC family hydrolase